MSIAVPSCQPDEEARSQPMATRLHSAGNEEKFNSIMQGVNRVAERIVSTGIHTIFLLDRSARFFEKALREAIADFGGGSHGVQINFIDPTYIKEFVMAKCSYTKEDSTESGGYSLDETNLAEITSRFDAAQFPSPDSTDSADGGIIVIDEFVEYGKSLFAAYALLKRMYPDKKVHADTFARNNRLFRPRRIEDKTHLEFLEQLRNVPELFGTSITLPFIGNEELHVLDDNHDGFIAQPKKLTLDELAKRMREIPVISDEITQRVRALRIA